MNSIVLPKFTKKDEEVLREVNPIRLEEFIEFLSTYKEPFPKNSMEYPKKLVYMGEYFEMLREKHLVDLRKVGFFDDSKVSLCRLGTMFTPSLIVELIADASNRDRFCDGLLTFGLREKNLYLRMLLHLLDCKNYYDFIHMNDTDIESEDK